MIRPEIRSEAIEEETGRHWNRTIGGATPASDQRAAQVQVLNSRCKWKSRVQVQVQESTGASPGELGVFKLCVAD
jgi:hypothetical protein